MTAMLKAELKAAEYRSRAQEASALADASLLERVREKYEVAAARWTDLALLNERQSRAPRPPTPGIFEAAPVTGA